MTTTRLIALDGGGFRLEDPQGPGVDVVPGTEGWEAGTQGGVADRILSPDTGDGSAGLVLRTTGGPDAMERGRTTLLEGSGPSGSDASLLLGDGRLFRILFRRGMSIRCELAGWETDGAYLVAEPQAGGWHIQPTTAGLELEDDGTILLLFAAHLAGLP